VKRRAYGAGAGEHQRVECARDDSYGSHVFQAHHPPRLVDAGIKFVLALAQLSLITVATREHLHAPK
jgi:hypothetical protein